jgi:TIR domain
VGNPIFISYRRDDAEGEAGRLFDDLTREFGSNSVFMDVAGIRPGVDFVKAIEENVADCGVLLAIIGPAWETIASAAGQRRLDDPNDFVVLEIASALKREVPVIPVLVHGAKMPSQDQLPESLKSFSHRNSVELSHARWPSDVQLLIVALNSYVAPSKATEQVPVHATVPVQLPPPHSPSPIAPPAVNQSTVPSGPPSRLPWIAGIGGVVAMVTALAIYLVTHHTPAPPSLVGTWKDTTLRDGQRSGDTLSSLEISGTGNNLSIHAFGSCQPAPCDWGTQPAVIDGEAATATFNVANDAASADTSRVASVRVSPSGSNLDVLVHNTFTEQGGSRSNQAHRIFVPGP